MMSGPKRPGNDPKTKTELIEEIEELRRKLADGQTGEPKSAGSHAPVFAGEISRRSVLKSAWVAPVILSVPIAATVTNVRTARAGAPTTAEPTASPTTEPTRSPTTAEPTAPPTLMPTAISTSFPTVRSAAVPVLSGGAAAAAAGALFGFGAKKLLSGGKAGTGEAEKSTSKRSRDPDDSGNEGGL